MKIALVHDMLVQEGGQERVLRALQEVFPDAPTFVLIYNRERSERFFRGRETKTSFLQQMPGAKKYFEWYLPLMATAIESFDFKDFDVVFSSCSSFAKGVLIKSKTTHICYRHTPSRFLWSEMNNYVEDLPYPNFMKKLLPFYLSYLRNWDWSAAQRVDKFLCNSGAVKGRIKKYYGREAEVIYPPVDTERMYVSRTTSNYFLIGGRLVPYKRYDLAIRAFNRLGIPLKVFGIGPEFMRLKRIARGNIEFLGELTENEKAELYSKCIAFLYPQEEDFGITAIEAMASGRPVIALKAGGALETIKEGETGEFFTEQSWERLANTIIHFRPEKYNQQQIKKHAEKFSKSRFKEEIGNFFKENGYL